MNIRKAADPIEIRSVFVVLYGQPGIRKTSWSFTAKKPLLLDYNQGVRRVKSQYRGDYLAMSKWEDGLEIFKNPDELGAYDTIVIDTVGSALELLTVAIAKGKGGDKLTKKDGALTIQGFGALAASFKVFLNQMRALNKNLVFIAHDKEVTKNDETTVRPDIQGQTLGLLLRDADLVGYMRSFNNSNTVTFAPTDVSYGKNTCALPNDMDVSQTTLADVIDKALENMNSDSKLYAQYVEQLKRVDIALGLVESVDELNMAMDSIRDIEYVSDAKAQVGNLIRAKVKEVGAVLNKTTKLYEPAEKKSTVPSE